MRAMAASLVLGALTTIALPVAYLDADPFWDQVKDTRAAGRHGRRRGRGAGVPGGPLAALVCPGAAGRCGHRGAGHRRLGRSAVPLPHPALERISDVAAGDPTLRRSSSPCPSAR